MRPEPVDTCKTLPMDWNVLSEQLDEIGSMQDRAWRLEQFRQLLTDMTFGEEGRAEVLTYLADDLMRDGQLDEAGVRYQEALDDGGRTVLEPHIGLLDVALARGDDARVDELLALLIAKSRADELVVGDHEWIGDSLEEAGRLREALRWFTIPLRDIQPGHYELMPIISLNGRWRVRRALGLPLDAYDDAHDVWQDLHETEPEV